MSINSGINNFTTEEFIIIASILGEDKVLGIENPFKKSSDEEILKKWECIKKRLIKKSYMSENTSGKLKIDRTIISIIKNCCSAKKYLMLNKIYRDKNEEYHFYLNDNMLIGLTEINSNLNIIIYKSFEELYLKINNILIDKFINSDLKINEFKLNEKVFLKLKKNVYSNKLEKAKYLIKENLSYEEIGNIFLEDMSERMILSLLSLDFRYSLKGIEDNKKLILGKERIWILGHNDMNNVIVKRIESKIELMNIIKTYASLKDLKEVK
jgi:hypothetical protein